MSYLNLDNDNLSGLHSDRLTATISALDAQEFGAMPPAARAESEMTRMQTLAHLEVARQIALLRESLASKSP